MGFQKLATAAIAEILPFPLYHGTSTIWRASIERHGLGGRRIVEELKAIAFYQRAMHCLKSLPADSQPPLLSQRELLATQGVTEGGLNFRHSDGVYLTPSRQTALGYARANALGSEIVSNCHDVYKLMLEQRAPPGSVNEYPELLSVFRMPPGKPMIVVVRSVRTSVLLEEKAPAPFLILNFSRNSSPALTRKETAFARFVSAQKMEISKPLTSFLSVPRRVYLHEMK